MRRYSRPVVTFLVGAALASSPHLVAEQGILVVNVRNAADVPVPGVQIGTVGDGASYITANTGRARIRLANQTRAGSMVTLQLVPPPADLVMMAPYGGRTAVPSFDNESDNYVAVLVIKRGDRQALENAAVLAAAVDRSLSPAPGRENKGRRGGRANAAGRLRMTPTVARWQDIQRPGNLRVVGPASGLVSEEVARELGFSVADVHEALRRFSADDRLWKAVILTANVEAGGRDPFSTVLGDISDGGLEFGIGPWSLGRGTLQPVLAAMRAADRERFDAIMGEDRGSVAQLLALPGAEAVRFARKRMVRGDSPRRVAEPWKSRFRALGSWPAFQRVQIDAMRPRVEAATAAARALGLRSERAFAFLYDTIVQHGTNATRPAAIEPQFAAFTREVGRAPDEQEKLLIIGNVAVARTPAPVRTSTRARRLAFALGTGTVYGRRIDLAEAGFAMRDFDTGDTIPLAGDDGLVKRLTEGWIPAGAAR